MRAGLPISLLLHGAVFATALVVLPAPRMDIMNTPPIVPVELVTVAEKTNVRAKAPKPEPEPEITPPVAPPSTAPKPEPEKVVALPPKPKPKKPVAEARPKPKPKPKKVVRPRKKRKPAPPAFDLTRLETKLAKSEPQPQKAAKKDDIYASARAAIGEGDAMTASEIDLLRAQMYRCWRAPLDAPDPSKLKVTVRARLNPDGTLAETPQVLNAGQISRSGDPFWRAAADNARRAVIKCQPYQLPPEKYALWRETIMHFDATDVLGSGP